MKFNVIFTMRGPGGKTDVPNKHNPIEAESMTDVLCLLSEYTNDIAQAGIVQIIGIRVDEVKE